MTVPSEQDHTVGPGTDDERVADGEDGGRIDEDDVGLLARAGRSTKEDALARLASPFAARR